MIKPCLGRQVRRRVHLAVAVIVADALDDLE